MKNHSSRLCSCIALVCCFALAAFGISTNLLFAQSKNKSSVSGKADYTRYVNPFVGTGGHGHTYPGATTPFGMVQLSPDTRLDGWDGCSGYHYSDSVIYGFSHTHLSGVGVSDYGDILFMPMVGEPQFVNAPQSNLKKAAVSGYASAFRHSTEKAHPGYYAVRLDDDGIDVELTATPRTGLHKYTFPATKQATIILDLLHRDKVLASSVKIVGNNRLEGFRRSDAWARDQHVYFVAEFSKPFVASGIAVNDTLQVPLREADGKNLKAFVRFETKANEAIIVKVGISAVSIEGARKNLEAELKDGNFEHARSAAQAAWNKELRKIEVSGGSEEQMRTFYTSLYHAMSAPNLFSDIDGSYRGLDGRIHTASKHTEYTIFSLWDTFRAAHPLYTIIDQKRTKDFINTFLTHYEQGGRLPVWELAANETDCMIGYHSVSVIADAAAKGIAEDGRGFDMEKALEAMKYSATLKHFGLEAYQKQGFIAVEDEAESVSKTLEYSYDDWCIAVMAKQLNKESDYKTYIQRAQYYKNMFDPETTFMRGRQNGGWFAPFDPREVNFNYTEGNSWHYSFFAPQDIQGLARLLGGYDKLEAKIDALFSADPRTTGREQADITGLIGQYAQGNEPSHNMAYLYNYVRKPWKTQALVRHILDSLYTSKPDGLPGNEDCGQMSAWYVLSALGFYQVTPGLPFYTIGTPLFKEARINLENGKTFIIKAPAVSAKNLYIQSASLGGKPHTQSYLKHEDLMRGGTLEFAMGDKPNMMWGGAERDAPQSSINDYLILPSPSILAPARTFKTTMDVQIRCAETAASIFYTTDGSEPTITSRPYTKPFTIGTTCTVKAIAARISGGATSVSVPVSAEFMNLSREWTIQTRSTFVPQYAAGGAMALIDGIRGNRDFRAGAWQGYWGTDVEAVVDLGKLQTISNVGAGFLQDIRPWIWMPRTVEFSVSTNGTVFLPVATIRTDVPDNDYTVITKQFAQKIAPQTARYVKLIARNYGDIPAWHLGAGNKAYIFIDEIVIE